MFYGIFIVISTRWVCSFFHPTVYIFDFIDLKLYLIQVSL